MSSKFQGSCSFCGKFGHKQAECWKRNGGGGGRYQGSNNNNYSYPYNNNNNNNFHMRKDMRDMVAHFKEKMEKEEKEALAKKENWRKRKGRIG